MGLLVGVVVCEEGEGGVDDRMHVLRVLLVRVEGFGWNSETTHASLLEVRCSVILSLVVDLERIGCFFVQ